MSERIVISELGGPGTGKTQLGKSVTREGRKDGLSIEHVSVGDRIRRIGAGFIHSSVTSAIVEHLEKQGTSYMPVDEDVMQELLGEILKEAKECDILLLDGYPRYKPQVDLLQQAAYQDNRTFAGMLVTTTDPETSEIRAFKRGRKHTDRVLSYEEVQERMLAHDKSFPGVLSEMERIGVPIATIDTTGDKDETNKAGLFEVENFQMLSQYKTSK